MDEIECPYCGHEFELCTDDGAHCEQDAYEKDECPDCGKYFMVATSWLPVRDSHKADCLNGGEHDFREKSHGDPVWLHTKKCRTCSKRIETYFKDDGTISRTVETG